MTEQPLSLLLLPRRPAAPTVAEGWPGHAWSHPSPYYEDEGYIKFRGGRCIAQSNCRKFQNQLYNILKWLAYNYYNYYNQPFNLLLTDLELI